MLPDSLLCDGSRRQGTKRYTELQKHFEQRGCGRAALASLYMLLRCLAIELKNVGQKLADVRLDELKADKARLGRGVMVDACGVRGGLVRPNGEHCKPLAGTSLQLHARIQATAGA